MHKTEDQHFNLIIPTPGQGQAEQPKGVSWVGALAPPAPVSRKVNINVFIEQAANPNWHAHPCSQMLIIMDGTGYYQEKGQPMQSLSSGTVIFTQAGVEHWHAPSLGCEFKHVVINTNNCKQIVTWLKRIKN